MVFFPFKEKTVWIVCVCVLRFMYVNRLPLTLYNTIPTFNDNMKLAFEKKKKNIVGKEENAGNQHFLLFPQSFFNHS